MPTLGWRWLLALSALPSLLLLIFYRVTPESPRYLCLKGRTTEALSVLEKIARMNRAELPPGILVSDHQVGVPENSNPSEDMKLLSPEADSGSSHKDIDSNMGGISSLFMLLSPKLLRSTLLLWMVFFGNAFSYYGLVLLTSELNNEQNKCGVAELQSEKTQDINYKDVFITSFAGTLVYSSLYCFTWLSKMFFLPMEEDQVTFAFGSPLEFPGLLLSAATVDILGRKLSMSAMFFLCCIFLLPLVFHQPQGLTTALLFGARICITVTFTVVYIYAPEVSREIKLHLIMLSNFYSSLVSHKPEIMKMSCSMKTHIFYNIETLSAHTF